MVHSFCCLFLKIIFHFFFNFILSYRFIVFYDKFSFMLRILNDIFWPMRILWILITIMFSSMIKMSWLNCCKIFCWFYYADTKDTVSVWFHFLIFINGFQLLFVLILEVLLIVCLELRFLILLPLLLFLHHLLVVSLKLLQYILLYQLILFY